MKMRERGTTRLSKLPKGVFRRISEYCEPKITTRVTDHQYTGQYRGQQSPINYTWPEQVSYYNPVVGVKMNGKSFCFRLQSGEETYNIHKFLGFQDLDWSQITSLVIICRPNSEVCGFEFYNSDSQSILLIGHDWHNNYKVNLSKGDRVVGFQVHKDKYGAFYNLQLLIIGYQ